MLDESKKEGMEEHCKRGVEPQKLSTKYMVESIKSFQETIQTPQFELLFRTVL